MLKKTITYDDFDDNEVTEDFYFNFTKLEAAELELEVGGLEETIERITKAKDAKEAYALFKMILLASVGKRSEDGRRFIKTPEIASDFEHSPALGELVIELLQQPTYAATFVENILPKKMVEAAKADKDTNDALEQHLARLQAQEASSSAEPATPTAPAEPVKPVKPAAKLKKLSEYSREELLGLSDEDFDKVAGKNPSRMSKATMAVAMERMTRAKVGS